MNSSDIEIFLARLYTDTQLYEQFIADPDVAMQHENFSRDTREALKAIDIQGLKLAVKSYHHKRGRYSKKSFSFMHRIKNILAR